MLLFLLTLPVIICMGQQSLPEDDPQQDPMILAQYADARADEVVVAAEKARRHVSVKEAMAVLGDYEIAE